MPVTCDAQVQDLSVQVQVVTASGAAITLYRTAAGKRATVRGVDSYTGHTGLLAVVDWEVPYNTELTYEAVVGAESDRADPVTVTNPGSWLRSVLHPAKGVAVQIEDHRSSARNARTALLRPVGRKRPVAVTDVREGQVGTTRFVTSSDAERTSMLDLIDSGEVLYLTGPVTWGLGPLYLAPQNVTEHRIGGDPTLPDRRWDVEWVEVDPPTALVLGTPVTWEVVDDETWLQLSRRTWADIMYPPVTVLARWTA